MLWNAFTVIDMGFNIILLYKYTSYTNIINAMLRYLQLEMGKNIMFSF